MSSGRYVGVAGAGPEGGGKLEADFPDQNFQSSVWGSTSTCWKIEHYLVCSQCQCRGPRRIDADLCVTVYIKTELFFAYFLTV